MRDPKRINNVMTTLKRVWKRDPDLRLGQLMFNFEDWVKHKYQLSDMFYVEDEVLERMLIEWEETWFGKEK